MTDERRQAERINVPRVLVKISTPDRLRVAYLKDLSEGGLFIKTDKPLAIGRELDIELLPPGRAEPIRLRGTVVRVRVDEAARKNGSMGMGAKFGELEPAAQAALAALVAEYQKGPAAPDGAGPDAGTVQLKLALERVEALSASVETRDQELAAERTRRAELQQRLLTLSQQLELNKAAPAAAVDASLQGELASARAEVAELRLRIAELEGDLSAYRTEVATLEQDDAATRALAEGLAQQKARLEAEARKFKDELVQLKRTVELASATSAARLAETAKELEAERERRVAAQRAADDAAASAATGGARLRALEEQLAAATAAGVTSKQASHELDGARARVATLEKALEAEKARTAKAVQKEREVRQLLATLKGDEVVVDDAPPPPTSVELGSDADGGGNTQVTFLSNEVREAILAAGGRLPGMPAPEAAPAPAPPASASPAAPVAASPATPAADPLAEAEPSIDVDFSWGGMIDAPLESVGQPGVLERLRANGVIVRQPGFAAANPTEPAAARVMAILEVSDRLDQLKNLVRGAFSEAEVERVLVELERDGLIRVQ